ncbi:MAG: cell division protein ZapA [Sphingomicrobium sp.]
MAELNISIAGRPYRVACRDGEEANLHAAAALVDAKSREALAGLGSLSEARQLLFAALLLADQLIEKRGSDQPAAANDPLAPQAEALAARLEALADALEQEGQTP